MKSKVLAGMLLSAVSLSAEVTTVLPYFAHLGYDSKATKKDGSIAGIYASRGNLSYLAEFNYARTNINYRADGVKALKQDDTTFIYSKYWINYSLKAGIHNIATTDNDLKNGNTLILGASSWKYFGYKKLSYGLDYYTSYYSNGTDLEYNDKKVIVNQLTPYVSFYKPFVKFSNFVSMKFNIEKVTAYNENYFSTELKDIVYYKKFYFEAGLFAGKMRTGIRDNGMTVYNSKDEIKRVLSGKIGYYLNKKMEMSLGYSNTLFDGFGAEKNTRSSASVATFSYKF